MNRTKWLKIEISSTHKKLVDSIRATRFDDQTGYGFDLSFRDGKNISAKFIEKIASVEVVTDPYGVSTRIETTRYSSIDFQLHAFSLDDITGYFMEINSPPRSLRTFISALSKCVSDLTVSEVEIPVLEVFRLLRKSSMSARLTRIKASQMKLTKESVATVDVISISNALADLKSFFPDSEMLIDKIRVERPFGAMPHAMEITRTGLISTDSDYADTASRFIHDILTVHYCKASNGKW